MEMQFIFYPDDRRVGRQIAQALALKSGAYQYAAQNAEGQEKVHHQKCTADEVVAQAWLPPIQPNHLYVQRFFAKGLPIGQYFRQEMVGQQAHQVEQAQEAHPPIRQNAPKRQKHHKPQQGIEQVVDDQINKKSKKTVPQRGEIVVNDDVLRGMYVYRSHV